MQAKKVLEAGYGVALYGLSLSYKDGAIAPEDWWCVRDLGADCMTDCSSCDKWAHRQRIAQLAARLADKDGGHNKFLEHIVVWLDIRATLEWWKQFDTYRVGVSKQSESTMHTLGRRDLTLADFDICVTDEVMAYIAYLNTLPQLERSRALPQGYLQRRQVVASYKVLRHIFAQRRGHRLRAWREFMDQVFAQLDHPELLAGVYSPEVQHDQA